MQDLWRYEEAEEVQMGMKEMYTEEGMMMEDGKIDGIQIEIIIITKDEMIGAIEENGIENIIMMVRTGKIRGDTGKCRLCMIGETATGGDPITNPNPKK